MHACIVAKEDVPTITTYGISDVSMGCTHRWLLRAQELDLVHRFTSVADGFLCQ